MKKIFTLLLTLGALTSVFAQGGYHDRNNNGYDQRTTGYDQRNSGYDQRNGNYDQHNNQTVYSNNQRGGDQRTTGYGNPGWNNQNNRGDERGRQQDMDRRDNDRRVYDERNNRYPVQNNGRYGQVQRNQNGKAFGGGVVVGAVAGVLLGVLLSK